MTLVANPPVHVPAGFFRRYPGPVWLLFGGRILTSAGFSFGFPFFTIYASSVLKESAVSIGLAVLVSGLVGSVAKYLGGDWADRWGRKPVMQLALAGRCVTSAAIAYVIWKGMGFIPLCAGLVTSNFFGQLFEPSSQAFVSDVTRGPIRTEAFGLVRMGINLGWALGLVLHGFLTQSYALAFLVTSSVFALSFLLISLVLREPAHASTDGVARGSAFAFASNRPFILLCLGTALISIVWSQLVVSTSVYVTRHAGISTETLPFLLAVNGSLVFLLQLPASRLMGRTGLVAALVAGSLFYAAGYGSYFACVAPWHFAVAIGVFTIGEVLVAPASTALAAQLAPDAERGRYLGIWGMASNGGFSFGPVIGGMLLDHHPGRSPAPWLVLAAIGVLAALVFATVRPPRSGPVTEVIPPGVLPA